MSLRDELLKAGLVNRKEVRRSDQQQKKKRKQDQGSRRKARDVRAETEAQKMAELEAQTQARQEQRHLTEEQRSAHEHAQRVRQIVLGNRLGSRGRVPFWHRGLDGKRLHRMEVGEKVAWMLRCGEAAIAGLPAQPGHEESYVVVSSKGAHRLDEVEPKAIVFRTVNTDGIAEADEGFLQRAWEPSLVPHRVEPPPER